MKKLIFTLMMMAGLALVAGTAMADNEVEVLPGNQYTYLLENIKLTQAANATIVIEGGVNTSEITPYRADGTTPFGTFSLNGTETQLEFQVAYSSDATPTTTPVTDSDSIRVRITYTGTSDCYNEIKLGITILPKPTYTLAISVDIPETCQERTGADHNLADARGDESNTITFTVTPTIENIPTGADFDFSYVLTLPTLPTTDIPSIALSPSPSGGNVTNSITSFAGGTYNTDDTYVLTFTTTTGVDSKTIELILDDVANNAVLTVDDGSTTQGNYAATPDGVQTASTTIKAVPTMGGFNL